MFLRRATLKAYLGAQPRFGHKLLGIRVRYMSLYGTTKVFNPFRTASRFADKLLGTRVRYMFLYTAVLNRYISRLEPQTRFGDELLGIRVRYMFLPAGIATHEAAPASGSPVVRSTSLGARPVSLPPSRFRTAVRASIPFATIFLRFAQKMEQYNSVWILLFLLMLVGR